MAPHEQRKPHNNARKAAARALQRQHPGMSYLQALAQVTNTDGKSPGDAPLQIRTLLGLSSAEDVTARQYGSDVNLTVPVGISDSGEAVTLNIASWTDSTEASGPHGVIRGFGALDLAFVFALALRANNGAERVQVAVAGAEHYCRAAEAAVDHVVPTPWNEWLGAQLAQRAEIAHAAKVSTLTEHGEVSSLVVLVISDDGHLSADERQTLERSLRMGRSLGVHVIIVCPDPFPHHHSTSTRFLFEHPGISNNVTFTVVLSHDGGRATATAATTIDDDQFSFSPVQFRDYELASWIGVARQLA